MEIKVSLIGRRIDSDNVTDRFWCCRVRFSFSFHGFQPSVHRLTFGPRLLIFEKTCVVPSEHIALILEIIFFHNFGGHMSFYEATDTPVLDIW